MNRSQFKAISNSLRCNGVSYTLRSLNDYMLECEVKKWLRLNHRENWLELRQRWNKDGKTEAFKCTTFVGKYAKFKQY